METFVSAEFQEHNSLKKIEPRSSNARTVDVTVAQAPIETEATVKTL